MSTNINRRVFEILESQGKAPRLIDGKSLEEHSWAELCSISAQAGRIVAELVGATWIETAEQFATLGYAPNFYAQTDESTSVYHERLQQLQEARIVPLSRGSATAVLFADISHPILDEFVDHHWLMAPSNFVDEIFSVDVDSEIQPPGEHELIESWIRRVAAECHAREASDIDFVAGTTGVRIRFNAMNEWGPWVGTLPISKKPQFLRALCAMGTPPQDFAEGAAHDFKVEIRIRGVDTSWRVTIAPAVQGEAVTMRILPQIGRVPSLEELGFPPEQSALVRLVCRHKDGLVLVTGSTGSGKSTTLYAIADELVKQGTKVCSAENPVELVIPGMVQLEEKGDESIDSRFRVTFAGAIRSFMRQKPDVIIVGETRDRETAFAAVMSARTGHLTFTTTHTADCAGSVKRLLDLGIEPTLLSDTVRLVVSQKLARKLCPHCRIENEDGTFRRHADGCSRCKRTGLLGRTVAAEICYLDDAARDALVRQDLSHQFERLAEKGLYISRDNNLQRLVHAGVIDEAEARTLRQETL